MYTKLLKHFCHLRLLRSLDVEENPRPRASRRLCRVVYANIWGLHRKLSNLSLIAKGGDVDFCKLIVPGFS